MWTNLHTRRIPQWVVLRQRFRIRHVQRSAVQFPRLERLHQRVLINDFPARDVGHIRLAEGMGAVGGEEGKFLCADEMGCLRGEREGDNEVVKTETEE